MRPFCVVSFFTEGTGYEREALKLIESLKAFNVIHDIRAVKNRGNWQKNTQYKADFLREMMDEIPDHNLVWLDADAIVRAYPHIFDRITEDVACHFRNRLFAKNELLSGTLFIQNIDIMRLVLDEWIMRNSKFPHEWEQRNLHRVLLDRPDVTIYPLPVEYCCIFDSAERRGGINPVIEHFQKSREYRVKVGLKCA